ncbi:MAG TPA: prepilin-type N-terminal cleavage/methylation domain-containing protein [Dongiaceae bacterium]|nr:prepilin-type N-terminal cleavage/methylation domain-containing protein [Dongiaceae bacterium]
MQRPRQGGFTILELLLAMGIFLIICGAMFELLDLSQRKYNTETQLSSAYQEARYAMDQITRDFNVSGYPPAAVYSVMPVSKPWRYATGPVAWNPNYPGLDCQIGVDCVTPGDYDLIIEARLSTDPLDSPVHVSWIWYHLDQTSNTLKRTVVRKNAGDPWATVQASSDGVPLLANVMNNPLDPAQAAEIKAENPNMYPVGTAQPIFTYTCDTPTGPLPCTSAPAIAAGYNKPRYIRDVNITLMVAAPRKDMQTQRYELVELNGRAHRLNPNN